MFCTRWSSLVISPELNCITIGHSPSCDHDSVQPGSPAADREGNRGMAAGYSPEKAEIYLQTPAVRPQLPLTRDPIVLTKPTLKINKSTQNTV